MTVRIIGAIMIVIGCSAFGILIAAAHRKEVKTLQIFLDTLDTMECELQYRRSPLPALCKVIAQTHIGIVGTFYKNLAQELESQIRPSVDACVQAACSQSGDIPMLTHELIKIFGRTMGQFDVEGQLQAIRAVRAEGVQRLESLMHNQDMRIRSYQTLGVCVGAALAILFI